MAAFWARAGAAKPGCKQGKCKDAASGNIQDYSQGYSRHDLIPK